MNGPIGWLGVLLAMGCSPSAPAARPTPLAGTLVAEPAELTRNGPPRNGGPVQLDKLVVPEGFAVTLFSDAVPHARSLAIAPDGTVFVSTRQSDRVYALRDDDGDHHAERVTIIAEGLDTPNGIAFRNGALFIAEIGRILRIDDVLTKLDAPTDPIEVTRSLPDEGHHGWKFIAFGPDDMLYVPVGAPCNVCEREEPIFSSIARMSPDGTGLEIFAHGVRNSVGFDWHPEHKTLWFTENGRDGLGDDVPGDELNHAPQKGMHFGFPYCHAGDIRDPQFGRDRSCASFEPPAQKLVAHAAALGMRFNRSATFPSAYRHSIFIAEHGSWNRSTKSGYRVMVVHLNGSKAESYEPFITGWLDVATDTPWGRPVDMAFMSDGSMLVSDDYAGAVYRVTFTP